MRISQVTVTLQVAVTLRITMTITRIDEVQTKPELTEDLRDFLVSIKPGRCNKG